MLLVQGHPTSADRVVPRLVGSSNKPVKGDGHAAGHPWHDDSFAARLWGVATRLPVVVLGELDDERAALADKAVAEDEDFGHRHANELSNQA